MIGGCPDNAIPTPSMIFASFESRICSRQFFAKAGSRPYKLGQHF